ncbi:DUF1403 family protein [Mesorhizobium sp. WSM3224]|uniref:DUF1403 family protein n=1 Tax=Mesorhizobium sp. WSM3224 TaxID=1040986 RepID=UPI0032B01F9A
MAATGRAAARRQRRSAPKIVDQLGFQWDGAALADLCTEIENVARSPRPAPFAAAAIAAYVVALRPDAELFAWWLADLVLAQSLRWPGPLPLLMAQACRLAAELSRRAEKLLAVAPKLRAKGAGDVIFLLLNEDAVSGSLTTRNLSRFAARRLFDRLQRLDAVRELSGRPSFRLFGL